ncbi:MAG TPA: aldo/keto reductase, partial [Phytomonospora sp.]
GLQYNHSYLRPRTDGPHWLFPDGYVHPGSELFGYLRAEPGLTLVAYSPLLKGAYTRSDKTLPAEYDHPGTLARMAALREVAAETGATLNQVVLAWQIGHEPPIIPLVGVSSLEQLEENLGGAALELTAGQRAKLDAAH